MLNGAAQGDATAAAEPRRRTRDSAPLLVAGVALAVGLASLHSLRALDYSTAELEFVETRGAADSERDAVGSLRWDSAEYANSPSLATYRDLVRSRCGNLRPVATARCVQATLESKFAYGVPSSQFVDPGYDPAAALASHLGGQRGHCLTYSGLIATSLLSVGMPARVVQLLPADRRGHTVVEVRDDSGRWSLYDPTYGGALPGLDGSGLATSVHREDAELPWDQLVNTPPVFPRVMGQPPGVYSRLRTQGGHVVYPEPWLYTRVGRRAAHWPFRGQFVVVGERTWNLGIAHPLLQAILAACAAALAVAGYQGARVARRRCRHRGPTSEGAGPVGRAQRTTSTT